LPEILSRRDIDFQLYDLLGVDGLGARPRHRGQDRQVYDAVLDAAFRLADEKFRPLAAELDANEPAFDGGGVRTLPALKDALDAYVDAGFLAAGFDEDHGGSQLPYTVALAAQLVFTAANNPAAGYLFLTAAAANLLAAHGSQEQRALYLEPMVAGRFFGTMALSEPHAGSSLADIRTRAEPAPEGHYLLSGSKMWISGGDQDLSENIVHLVLAKIPGGPPGVKGISLFIVPKFLVNADGSPGARNDVRLVGLNHKLGHRGTTNCALDFGGNGACVGYLVGEPHRGLAYMFHMMNEARIGVGAGAAVTAYTAYLAALDYARERLQGRPLDAKDPASPQVPLVAHADVRRMLLAQKAISEGSLALCLYCARLVDEARSAEDEAARERARLLLDVLTPIAKSWPSERGVESNSLAIQVLGGAGYTRDHPLERLFRDQRLNPIHEGTTGIQGLDLLGRKVGLDGGRGFALLLSEMRATIARVPDGAGLRDEAAALETAVGRLASVTETLLAAIEAAPARALANATAYLDMAGTVVVGWLWLAQAAKAAPQGDAFARGKLAACRYFARYELPRTGPQATLLESLDTLLLDLDPATL